MEDLNPNQMIQQTVKTNISLKRTSTSYYNLSTYLSFPAVFKALFATDAANLAFMSERIDMPNHEPNQCSWLLNKEGKKINKSCESIDKPA